MGKGDPRNRRKAPKSWPGAAPLVVADKPAHPRDRRHTNQPADDPRKTALTARCVQMGIEPTKEGRQAMAIQAAEHPLGRVMLKACIVEEVAELWRTWSAVTAARRTFMVRILGTTGEPSAMRLPVAHGIDDEPSRPSKGEREEYRTDEELDLAARSAWGWWIGRIDALPAEQSDMVMDALQGTGPSLWYAQQRQATRAGLATLDALRALHLAAGKG